MNIDLDPARVQEVREGNDRFRRTLSGGTILLSAGIIALGGKIQSRILEVVRTFDDFQDDDPTDTHALGDFVIAVSGPETPAMSELIFFRIDHLCPTGGDRCLSIFLASEWWSPPIESMASICLENKS